MDHGYRYIQHCRSNSLDRLTIFLIYKGCCHADASTHLSFPGPLISRLVDLHATRACHPLSTLSRITKYLYVKNRDSYTIIAAIGLAAKGLRYNWIRLGRQRESGMLRALGPYEPLGWPSVGQFYLNHDRTLLLDFYPVPIKIKMQIQISQQDAKNLVPYYANGIAALLLGIAEDFMPAKKSYGQNSFFFIPICCSPQLQ